MFILIDLPDDDDESLLLDESSLLESLESLVSLLDELDEWRLRLFDFFFLLRFEPLPLSLRSLFMYELIADEISLRFESIFFTFNATNKKQIHNTAFGQIESRRLAITWHRQIIRIDDLLRRADTFIPQKSQRTLSLLVVGYDDQAILIGFLRIFDAVFFFIAAA